MNFNENHVEVFLGKIQLNIYSKYQSICHKIAPGFTVELEPTVVDTLIQTQANSMQQGLKPEI